MAFVKVVRNESGIRALLKGPEVMADLEARGKRIADKAGPGHDVRASRGRRRGRVTIGTQTIAARLSQSKRATLSQAIDAGR